MENKIVKLENFRTLDEAVNLLLIAKERGLKAYCDFNGHKLYSDNITVDSAYLEVTGQTKEEYNLSKKEYLEKLKKKNELAKQNAQNNIPIWIEKGKKIIFEEKYQEWEDCVVKCANSIYNGKELDAALEIMEALENEKSLEQAIDILKQQNHSGASESLVKNIIFEFSPKGPEFYVATTPKRIVHKNKTAIEEKIKENKELAKKHIKILKK